MPLSNAPTDAGEAFGAVAPPHAGQAFGEAPVPGSRRLLVWLAPRARPVVLLFYLAVAVIALVRSDNVFVARDSASSAVANGRSAPAPTSACVPGQPPELTTVDAKQLLELRTAVQTVSSRAGGQAYAWGSVSPSDVWTDGGPESRAERARTTRWPGSYEIRQWVGDPQWGASYRDDIVVDVFLFSDSAHARRFFGEAASLRCRRSASALPTRRLPEARNLTWINPDDEREEDVYLLRGRTVYRLVVVRPQNHEPPPSRAADRIGFATVEELACALPGARCSPPRAISKGTAT